MTDLMTETQLIRRISWLTVPWMKKTLGIISLVMLFLLTWQTCVVIQKYRQTLSLSEQQSMQKTRLMAESISAAMSGLEVVAEQLAKQVANVKLDQKGVEAVLHQAALNHPGFYTLGVAFDLYEIDPGLRLYAPLIHQNGSFYRKDRVDSYYDYIGNEDRKASAAAGEDWFLKAQQGRMGWLVPYYDRVHDQYVVKYVLPVKSMSLRQAPRRVVFVDIQLDWIRQQIESHDIGNNGYAILANELGQVLYDGLKGAQKTVNNFENRLDAGYLASLGTGRLGKNILTGSYAWQHSVSVGKSGWSLMTVMNITRQDKQLFSVSESHQLIHKSDWITWIVSCVLFLLFVYLWWILVKEELRILQLWRHSAVVSLLLIAGIIGIWICEFYFSADDAKDTFVLSNSAAVAQFQKDYAIDALQQYKQPPLYIPAGLFIQSVEFLNAADVIVTGYIWLRYPKSHSTDAEQGVIFPEAIETSMTESYLREQGNDVVRGWHFRVTLRELFDYSVFPFDRQSVWIRLWHQDFGNNIILVPDFKSYDSLNPSALPGIERDFVLSGWQLSRTFYEMRMKAYNTNFGKVEFSQRDRMPELYFNIELSRKFINPFISHVFPLLVVLLMLFAIIMTITRNERRKDLLGFNAATVIASCSALFFVILIAHVQLRDTLSTNNIVYLEYFYLISYIMLLMVTLNALLFSKDTPFGIVGVQDNLIPKITYWPFLSGCLFLCTAVVFWS